MISRPPVRHELPNGLRVAIVEEPRVPIVAVNLWYHVGSANEREGRTGFAHLFEHMLFQGSQNVAANEHFELIQRAGGTLNGSTWLDRTNYFETLPSNQLELALWLEADRMGRLLPAMTQEKLDTQRDVVKNERRWSIDNQPYGTWWEKLPALAFPPGHPFHHSLMGSMEDLSAATLDDVRSFFATWYTPDNCVISIVGDVVAADAIGLVSRHFGSIPRGPGRTPLPDMSVPRHFGEWKREIVEDEVAAARLFLAFRIEPFGTHSHRAATLLATILGGGRGSRMQRRLMREEGMATAVTAFTFDLAKGADLLVVDATGRPGVAAGELEEATVSEVDRLMREGADADETERAITLTTTEEIVELQAAQEHADKLSMAATYFDDPGAVYGLLAGLRSVDAEALARQAAHVLGRNNRISLIYTPAPGSSAS
ncbi:MAG: M16 family metallopeptidase [Gemmatimonadota bacterium]